VELFITPMIRPSRLALLTFLTAVFAPVLPAAESSRPNVLFLAVDDLRDDLGAYGVAHARTPNLDRFASGARFFTRHYVQVPTCGASRCALVRGAYPTEAAHLNNNAILSTHGAWQGRNLPAWFRTRGYRTLSLGKITHYPGNLTGRQWAEGAEELPGAWDRAWIPESPWRTAEAMMHGYANGRPRTPGKTLPWEAFDGPDTAYPDAWVAADAVRTLGELQGSTQPWFLAVGLFKPHLPFAAPRKYFDLHDPEKIPLPENPTQPQGTTGWHASSELRRNYGNDGRDPASDPAYVRHLRQAYAAATSYVDAQAGRILDALQTHGLDRNTIVVVWGDHGFLLGDHAIWGKHCLYERALRSPLMIRVPGLTKPGQPSAAVVETVDIFPTLADLCGLPVPEGLDGRSLRAQLNDPAAPSAKPALGFWTGGQRTVRTERWRLIAHGDAAADPAKSVELFDLNSDPAEKRNVAAQEPAVTRELLSRLRPLIPSEPRAKKKSE
jgi:iduronate 2-sulfatase